jgi:phosphate transport system protein
MGVSPPPPTYSAVMAPPPLPQLLDELSELVGRMCTQAAATLRDATAGLLEGRLRLAEKVVEGDAAMAGQRSALEKVATDALLFHAPVAGDLRRVVAAIRSADDLGRMGVLARHVAEAAVRRGAECAVPEQVRPSFAEMGRVGVALALKAAEVVRTGNVLLAVELDHDDEEMDALHERLFEVLVDHSWPHGARAAVDVTLLARYYERFADHAVLVADETVRAVTGERRLDVAAFLGPR